MPFTRAHDPETGDRRWDPARGAWAEALTPELAIVQHVLATPLGSARRDPTFGVKPLENVGPNAAAVWRQNVLTALKRWIDAGVLREVEVQSAVEKLPEGGSALLYTVSFVGRSGRRQATPRLTA